MLVQHRPTILDATVSVKHPDGCRFPTLGLFHSRTIPGLSRSFFNKFKDLVRQRKLERKILEKTQESSLVFGTVCLLKNDQKSSKRFEKFYPLKDFQGPRLIFKNFLGPGNILPNQGFSRIFKDRGKPDG